MVINRRECIGGFSGPRWRLRRWRVLRCWGRRCSRIRRSWWTLAGSDSCEVRCGPARWRWRADCRCRRRCRRPRWWSGTAGRGCWATPTWGRASRRPTTPGSVPAAAPRRREEDACLSLDLRGAAFYPRPFRRGSPSHVTQPRGRSTLDLGLGERQ